MIISKRYYDWKDFNPTAMNCRFVQNGHWVQGTSNASLAVKAHALLNEREGSEVGPLTFTVTTTGKADVVRPFAVLFREFGDKLPFAQYKALCDAGVILMSNYAKGKIICTPHNGENIEYDNIDGYMPMLYQYVQGFYPTQKIKALWDFSGDIMDRSIVCIFDGSKYVYEDPQENRVAIRSTTTSLVNPPNESETRHAIDSLIRFRGADSVLIQRNIANANNGDLDALTALAEMPELIQSIVDGLQLLKKGAISARKREIYVSKQHKKKIRLRAEREFIKNSQFPSRKKYFKREGNLKNYARDRAEFMTKSKSERIAYVESRITNLRKHELVELGNAISGVWLNYRYNISPTVYMIQDAATALNRLGSIYRSTRSKNVKAVDPNEYLPEDWTFIGNYEVVDRAHTKRSYQGLPMNIGDMILQGLGFDVLVTALERVPLWGIVVNWFVEAANFLRAIDWVPKYKQSVSCFSQKITLSGKLYKGPISPNSPYWDINGRAYYRQLTDPYQHLGLHLNINITDERKLDALAFFWSRDRKGYLTR